MHTMGRSSRMGRSSLSMVSQGFHVSGLDLGQSDDSETFEPKRGKMKIRRTSTNGSRRTSLFAAANRSNQGSGMFSIGELSGSTPVPFADTQDEINPKTCSNNIQGLSVSSGEHHLNPITQTIKTLQAMGDSGFDMSDSEEEGGDS